MALSMQQLNVPLSPLGAKEEDLLEGIFESFTHFLYDKAKDIADREKEGYKASPSSPYWGLFMNSVSILATAEQKYMSLVFLESKGFFSRTRDSLKIIYHNLRQEFSKISDIIRGQNLAPTGLPHPGIGFDEIMLEVCDQLYLFVQGRQRNIDFYEQISTMGHNSKMCINYQDLVMSMSEIMETHGRKDLQKTEIKDHIPSFAKFLKFQYCYECEVINHLLRSQVLMTEWQYLSSLLQLHQAHSKLATWGSFAITKEVKKSAFGGTSRQTNHPAVFNWLIKFKNLLVSKFSLYFTEVLQKQTSVGDMKSLTSKLSEDFVAKITSFQKKSDASHVCLILDTFGLSEPLCAKPGYHLPSRCGDSEPTGVESYPVMFSIPSDKPLKPHMPSILMQMNNRPGDQNSWDKLVSWYDKTTNTCYVMTLVDVRITFVAVYDNKKAEKDTYINNFVQDLKNGLNCVKLFMALKPGAKT